MRILLSNDDGYQALGLRTLGSSLEKAGHEVWISAPSEERSGQSHAITLFRPILTRHISERCLSVHGTPADSVAIGLQHLLADLKPDFVISGINHGLNVGTDVNYSGTVGAATEASLLGFRAIAISTDLKAAVHQDEQSLAFSITAALLTKLLPDLQSIPWNPQEILNINHPGIKPKGLRQAPCASYCMYVPTLIHQSLQDHYPGTDVFFIGGNARQTLSSADEDVKLIQEGFVTFSFLQARQSSSPRLSPELSQVLQRVLA